MISIVEQNTTLSNSCSNYNFESTCESEFRNLYVNLSTVPKLLRGNTKTSCLMNVACNTSVSFKFVDKTDNVDLNPTQQNLVLVFTVCLVLYMPTLRNNENLSP